MITTALEITRRGFTLVWALLFMSIGIWTLSYTVPAWTSKATALFSHYVGGWNERACERNKEACLTAKYGELDALHSELSSAIGSLGSQKSKIARDLNVRERDLAGNKALLEEGRQLYSQASQSKRTIFFAGREYTPEALKRQLEVLYQEGPALNALVTQVRAMDEALDRKLNDLLVKRTKIRAARDLLPSQIELVRANTVIGDIEATLRDVTSLSSAVSTDIAELKDIGGWLSTTSELIRRKVESDRNNTQSDFERWLNGNNASTPDSTDR
jgi:chromosome segregation ATPase